MMLVLSDKWASVLVAQPETGMDYQIATVSLRDGRQIEHVTIAGGIITEVAGNKEISFLEDEIIDIRVTQPRSSSGR